MFRTFKINLTWGELIKRTLKDASDDNILGLAAQLAFYFFLALVPALLFLIALAGLFPGDIIRRGLQSIEQVAPPDVLNIIRQQVRQIAQGQNTGILTFGFVAALWSSSSAIVAIIDAMNRAYDIEEGRSWLRVRITAILLTIGISLFIILSLLLVLVGPTIAEWIAQQVGLGRAFTLAWSLLQWPVVFALVVFAIGLVFYFAPDAEQDWEWITPGALLATVLWVIASLGFRIYVVNFGNYNETYGTLGGIMVLLLWFYISGLAILMGAEMNAEIEHASPHAKAPGEKVAGQKKKLGAAAARAFEAAGGSGSDRPARTIGEVLGATPPAARPVPAPSNPIRRPVSVTSVLSGIPIFLTTMLLRRKQRS